MADIKKTVEIIFGAVDNTGGVISNLGNNLNSFSSSVGNVTGPLADLSIGLLKTEGAVLALAAAYGGFAISQSIKFKNAQIDLAKVLQETDPSIESFTNTVIELSEEYGVASASILQGIANFKQAGFTAQEAATLQKNALDLVIAGDVEATQANELLVASLKGFGAEASEASRFIEALNNVSNVYATDLEQLSLGMARLSPIASKMGFSFEEATGLITPVIEIFRSGPEAANALRTGLLKLIDDSKPVGEALAKIGVNQRDVNGEMRSGKDIFFEVGEAFKSLDESQKLVITSQLVGVEQAAKMVTVFDNLGKVQAITNVAMEETGSVTEEVALRLESAGKQIDKTVQAFNNLGKSVGDELVPAFGDVVGGTNLLIKAFRDVVDAGGLDPLFKSIQEGGADIKTFLEDVAKALPEAFEGLDFSGLLDSFGNLKEAVQGLFGGLDLTNVDDLQTALQNLIEFITLLTNASSGVASGLVPLVDGIKALLTELANSDSDTQQFIGSIGGIATAIDSLLPILGFFGTALTTVGGALAVVGGAKTLTAVTGLSTALGSLAGKGTALGLAFAGVTFGITENVNAYKELQKSQQDLEDTQNNSLATQEKLKEKLKELSDRTGVVVTSQDELSAALKNGTIAFDENTQQFEAVSIKTEDYVDIVNKAAESSLTWGESTRIAKEAMAEFGVTLDDTTVNASLIKEEQDAWNKVTSDAAEVMLQASKNLVSYNEQLELNAQALKDTEGSKIIFEQTADGIRDLKDAIGFAVEQNKNWNVEIVDGQKVLTTWNKSIDDTGDATKKTGTQIETIKAKVGELLEKEKEAIEQTLEFEKTLLQLASNEKIAELKFQAEIDVAQIEADAKQVEAAFQAVAETVTATSQAAADMFDTLANGQNINRFNESEFKRQFEEAAQRAQQALDNATKLNDAQIEYLRERTKALSRGDAKIKINADSLQPVLRQVLISMMELVQIEANAEGLELLI